MVYSFEEQSSPQIDIKYANKNDIRYFSTEQNNKFMQFSFLHWNMDHAGTYNISPSNMYCIARNFLAIDFIWMNASVDIIWPAMYTASVTE